MSLDSSSTARVQKALSEIGIQTRIVEFPQGTRTAQDAANAIGCTVAQIVKSIVLRTKHSQQGVLVLTSGANRVNEKRIAELVGEPIEKADADFVRTKTGYVIGGVAPVGSVEPLITFADEDLWQYDEIWAAAGTPSTVFCLRPSDLDKIDHCKKINVK